MKRLEFLETKRTPRYSLRKLNVGVASILLGVTIFGINFTNHSVKAATESVEGSNSSANSRLQQTSAVGNTTAEQTNTQKTTRATQKVQQNSVSNDATANNSTEATTTLQSAPKTQGSADTDIKSSTAKSVATNLVTISGTDRNAAAKLATMNLLRMNLMQTNDTDGSGAGTVGKENQDLANKTNLTSSDNYSSNIYKGKDGKYYKIVTIRGQDYVYRTADIQANGTARFQSATTAEDTKNNINISKEDLGNGKTRWTVVFFPHKGLQNVDSELSGLSSAKFGIALTSDYQIVGNVDMKVISNHNQAFTSYTFEPGSNSATDITVRNPKAEVDFSFNPKTDVDSNTGLINNSETMPAYNNEYLQGPYYFTTATKPGAQNLWQTYFFNNGNEVYYNNACDGTTPYLGGDHDFHFNNFEIKNETGAVDGAEEGAPIIYDRLGYTLNSENGLANSESGVFSSDDFSQAMEFKSQGSDRQGNPQFSSYVISFTTQHTDSNEVDLATGPKNQQFSGISANIYSFQNVSSIFKPHYRMYSSLYGEQRALNAKDDDNPLKADYIIPNWDAKKAANAAVDAAVVKQKALITNADNLSDGEKRDLNNQVAAAATNAKKAIDAATTNDGATKAGQDGVAAIEKVVPTSLADAKTALTDAISKGEAAQKSASYYNDANGEDKSALDKALSQAGEDLKNNALTQATADQDAQAIKDAINGLKGQPTNLDKLNQAISDGTSAQAGSKYANSSDESKGALDQAIKAGQTAKTQSGLTQKEADADASAIETAIKGLSGKETDKTALTDAISKGEAAQKSASYYNDANGEDKSALDKALSQAGEDLKNNALTQATADQDAQAIKDAINGLKGQPTNLDKLNQAISDGTSAQAGSKYANSSDESKGALDQAIKAGQTAKTQSGLTQKEADADASAIETAIKGLSGKETDKTALTDAISKGEAAQKSASYYNDANGEDKSALDKALSQAGEDLKNNALTQATADQDAQAIKDAINGLKGQPTNLDKLNQAISDGTSAQAGSKYANSSDESKGALDQAIKAGQTAKTQSGLTQKEADADASAIETAIKGLSGKETDKTALTDAISKGEAAQKSASYYNDANGEDKSALDKALSQAGEDLKNNALTQATADQDAQAIKDAINGLKGQPTNLDKLNQAISDGTSAQAGSKYANSSDESKGALDQAIKAGQTAKTQSGLTQKEADADASAIETAIKGLSGKETDKTALTDAISKGEAAQKSASYYNDANGEDKSALDKALSQAGEDLKNNALTQATADQDAQAIKDAINGLKGQPTNLDKLNQAISDGTSAQAGSKYANSSDESKGALDQAIKAGQTAKTQSGLTQKEADADASAIETAIKGLSGKETDKTALTDAISKGEAAQKSASYYNDANGEDKSALDKALSQAGEDLKNNALTQATADQDAQAIKDAINGLKGQPTNLDKLNQAISDGTSAQAGSKYANSSDESKGALDQAIKAGQTAKTQSGLTQKEADADASAIETAIKGLSGKETDKTALTDAISKGEAAQKSASYYNDANGEDKSALDKALSQAGEDLKNNALTQATADQDAQAIKDAINGLKGQPTNLDKLNQAISDGTSAQAGSKYANSSDESKGALDQAIKAGQTAKTQSGLTQKEADADASAIETAIKGLSGKETDKTALTDAISKGEAAQKSASYYNDANGEDKSALDKALSQAGEDLKNNALTQATADQDAQAIKDAINGLKGQPTNLDKLNQAISDGTSAQAGSKYANSSDESKGALDQAIKAGQTAKTQSGLTQKEADADASAIETAIKGLSGKETDKTALTDAISKGEAAQKSASYYNDANGEDKSALDKALSQAGEDLKNNALTQATADQDAQAIKDAINGLKGQPTNLDKLNQAISDGTSAQAGSKYANSSDESKGALDQAIKAGQTAKTQSGLTQKEADADASAIETAIKGLSGKETDKTALTDAISKGEAAQKSASYYNDANGEDKSALDKALSQAGEDLKNNALTQATADQDAQAIKDAINGLKGQPTNLDKLNQAISDGTSAQAGSKYANSSDESKGALDQAIKAGQTAKTQSGLTQKEADADASAIETAIKGLSGKETDKTALTDAISKGEAAQKSASYYNDANGEDKSALDKALSQAGEDLKNNALTQATADQDAQAIKDAINGLKGQPTNLDKLNQAISDGTSAQAGSKYANSSDESKGALDQAIKAGQTAKTQSGLTQKEADADASAIETAIKGLSGKETDKTALTDAISKGEAAQKSASYYNDANGEDKSALDKALSQAGEDLKNNALTQATADQDAQAIKDAINGLKGQPTNLDKLNQAISDGTSAQAGSKYANSSDESKGALDQAIKAGQTAKTQSGLTQKEADADASAIETAIKGLSGKETDKTALTDAISKGEAAQKSASYYNDANGEDKSALDKALSQAGEDLKNNALTQATADQDAQAIKDAINGLKGQPTNLDKLNQAISDGTSAQAGSKYANSSDESKGALDQAIKAGQTAKTQSGLTQKEADADASAIETAIKGLSGKETDKTALTDAISKGEAAQKSASYYNDANGEDKSALDKALSQAGEDLKNNALTQATADQDAQAIKDAINGLKGQPTNLDKLNQAISDGTSAQAGSKYANSSDESKGALDQAIKAGQTAKTQSGLTQKEADADASAIETAIKGLSGKETDKTALTDAISKGEAAQKSASYYNDANGEDKSALDKALSQAGEDLKNNALTQATADQDAQAIKDAINGLKGQPTNLDKLNQAISDGTSAQAGSKYANSSDESKGALDQAIKAGQTAKTQSGLTQKEADADASAIETAIKGLSGKETDKTALTDAISKGEAAQKSASYYNDANGEDKSALDKALSQAGEDLKNNALTQATADQDAQAIKDAINGLKGQPTNLDKLNQAISDGTSAQAGSKYANSSDESKGALDQAIKAGQTAKTQSGLTQKEADADASAIETAIKGLSGKETDKTALTDAISKGEAAQKSASYYNDANGEDKSALDKALSQAGEDLKNNALTQATADQDAQAIKDAINGLKGQPTNLDKLNQAISDGTSAQAGSKYANSSDESKGALDQAIKAGQTAKTQSGLTQKEADADASAIETAIKGLSGKETDKTALTDAISKGEAAQKSASYYNDANGEDKSALDKALSQAGEDLKNNALTQATADQDAQAIKDAINGLKGQPTSLEDAKKAANKVVEDAVDKQKALITKANNLSDKEKQALNNQVDAAAKTAKDAITAAKTNDVATKAGQDGKTAIEAVTVPTDSDVKKNAKNAIDQAAKAKDGAIDASNLTAEEKDTLKQTVAGEVNKAKAAIDAATKDADVKTAQNNGEKAINAVEIPASASKTAAINAINTALAAKKGAINGTDLTAEEKTALVNQAQKLVDDAVANINKATTNDAVKTAKENGVEKINNVNVPATSATKDAAKNAINQAAKTKDGAIDASNLTAEEKADLKKKVAEEVQKAKGNIDDAKKAADVKTAQTNGEKAINTVEIPKSSKTKNDANSDIDKTAAAAKKAIDETSGLTDDQKQTAKGQIDQAVTDAQEKIKNASDNQGVADATAAGKLAIDKVSAKAAIDGALTEKNNSIDAAPNLTVEEKQAVKEQAKTAADSAKTDISKASTVTDVESAKNDGLKKINDLEVPTHSKAKAAAIAEIYAELNKKLDAINHNLVLVTEEKAALTNEANTAADKAKDAINKAASNADVESEEDKGITNIQNVDNPAKSQVKEADKAAVQAVADSKINAIDDAPNLTAEEKAELVKQVNDIASNAKVNIDNSSSSQSVETVRDNGISAIKAVEIPTSSKTKNDANSDLDNTAAAVKKAIDETSGLTDDQKQTAKDQIDQAVADAKENIKNASDNTGVADATDAGKLAIDKVSAKAAIDAAVAAKKSKIAKTPLTAEEAKPLNDLVDQEADAAKDAIDAATTNAVVEAAKNNGVETINNINVPATFAAKDDANKAIADALAKKIDEINKSNLTDDHKQSLIDQAQNAANQAKENVRSASTDEDVQTAKNTGIAAINGIPVKSNSVDDQDNSAINEGNGNQAGHIQSDNSSDATKHGSTQQSGNVTDANKDTIPGKDLIIGVKGEGISGNNAEGMNGNTAKSGSKNNSLKTLPQTGTKDVTILEILGLFLSLFGLLGLKKKHREE